MPIRDIPPYHFRMKRNRPAPAIRWLMASAQAEREERLLRDRAGRTGGSAASPNPAVGKAPPAR
jgi:hypothetical protein